MLLTFLELAASRQVINEEEVKNWVTTLSKDDLVKDNENGKKWLSKKFRLYLLNEWKEAVPFEGRLPKRLPTHFQDLVPSGKGYKKDNSILYYVPIDTDVKPTDGKWETTLKNSLRAKVGLFHDEIRSMLAFGKETDTDLRGFQKIPDLIKKAKDWAKANRKLKSEKEWVANEGEIEILREYPDGYSWVNLLNKKALQREGFLMNHCVGDAEQEYISWVATKEIRILSLRDEKNIPHVTVGVWTEKSGFPDGTVKEARGNSNSPIKSSPPYVAKCKDLFTKPIPEFKINYPNNLAEMGILEQDGKWYSMYNLPKNFIVAGDLDLSYAAEDGMLMSLPDNLVVSGELKLNVAMLDNCTGKDAFKGLKAHTITFFNGIETLANVVDAQKVVLVNHGFFVPNFLNKLELLSVLSTKHDSLDFSLLQVPVDELHISELEKKIKLHNLDSYLVSALIKQSSEGTEIVQYNSEKAIPLSIEEYIVSKDNKLPNNLNAKIDTLIIRNIDEKDFPSIYDNITCYELSIDNSNFSGKFISSLVKMLAKEEATLFVSTSQNNLDIDFTLSDTKDISIFMFDQGLNSITNLRADRCAIDYDNQDGSSAYIDTIQIKASHVGLSNIFSKKLNIKCNSLYLSLLPEQVASLIIPDINLNNFVLADTNLSKLSLTGNYKNIKFTDVKVTFLQLTGTFPEILSIRSEIKGISGRADLKKVTGFNGSFGKDIVFMK